MQENNKPKLEFDIKQVNLLSPGKPFDVLIQLLRVGRDIEHELTSKLSYFDLSNGRLKVLVSLMSHERPLNPSELAEYAGVTRSTITGLLDGLEKDEFISRSTLEDRRKTAIYLTEKGREVVNTLTPLYSNHIVNIFSKVTEEEQVLFMELLEKVKDGLQEAKENNTFPI